MPANDEQIIREALEAALEEYPKGGMGTARFLRDAIVALDRLTAQCLPELPAGWFYTAMYQTDVIDPARDGWLIQIGKGELRSTGEGPTPRVACEAAIADAGKQP
jgi:hypothetical protein